MPDTFPGFCGTSINRVVQGLQELEEMMQIGEGGLGEMGRRCQGQKEL